jgi:hypothetical protein
VEELGEGLRWESGGRGLRRRGGQERARPGQVILSAPASSNIPGSLRWDVMLLKRSRFTCQSKIIKKKKIKKTKPKNKIVIRLVLSNAKKRSKNNKS